MNPNYSETPRTDLAEENLRALGGAGYVPASHARELERELNNAAANYNLCHANLGREVVKCGELATANKKLVDELAETKLLLAHKNETADTFMRQIEKLHKQLMSIHLPGCPASLGKPVCTCGPRRAA